VRDALAGSLCGLLSCLARAVAVLPAVLTSSGDHAINVDAAGADPANGRDARDRSPVRPSRGRPQVEIGLRDL